MIDVDYNEYKKTIAENMKLIVENHKLKEMLNAKEVYTSYLPEDTEFIIMTKDDYERQEIEYRTRIDKAIEYIENTKFDLSNDEYDLREYDGAKLLKILQGEDKE